MSFNLEQLRNLCDKSEGKEELERAKLIKAATGGAEDVGEEKIEKKEPELNGFLEVSNVVVANSNEKKNESWSKEEIELLKKGMLKYPKGTSQRWEVVSEFIGTGRSVEEILKATKTVLLQKPDSSKAFDSFLEKRKPAASIASPLSTREGEGGLSNGHITEKAVSNGHITENGVSNGHITEKKVAEPDNLQDLSSQKTKSQTSEDSASVNDVSESDQDSWSAVQEKALVQALKTFPKEASQRWERVASAVPGKTVSQCKKKFSLIKESFRNKKTGV